MTNDDDRSPPVAPTESAGVTGSVEFVPAPAPTESTGRTAAELGELGAVVSPPPVVVAVTSDREFVPAPAPTESTGRTGAELGAVVSPAASLTEREFVPAPAPTEPAGQLAEAPAEPAPAEVPAIQRLHALPARPRVRMSFWFEGDALKCEGVLLDEARNLVRRSSVHVGDQEEKIFAYFAAGLVADLRASGAIIVATTPAAAVAPASSDDSGPVTPRDGST